LELSTACADRAESLLSAVARQNSMTTSGARSSRAVRAQYFLGAESFFTVFVRDSASGPAREAALAGEQ